MSYNPKIVFSVPAYNEGKTPLTLLKSIRKSSISQPQVEVECVLTVNEGIKASVDVKESNRETITQVLEYGNSIGTELKILINNRTGGKSIRECNVGKAREEGLKYIRPKYNPDDVIVVTDADCTIEDDYIKKIDKETNKKGADIYGGLATASINSDLEKLVEQLRNIDKWSSRLLPQLIIIENGGVLVPRIKCLISGANMIFKKRVADCIGFTSMNGGEDSFFSCDAYEKGFKVGRLDAEIFFSSRFSDRVCKITGYGAIRSFDESNLLNFGSKTSIQSDTQLARGELVSQGVISVNQLNEGTQQIISDSKSRFPSLKHLLTNPAYFLYINRTCGGTKNSILDKLHQIIFRLELLGENSQVMELKKSINVLDLNEIEKLLKEILFGLENS